MSVSFTKITFTDICMYIECMLTYWCEIPSKNYTELKKYHSNQRKQLLGRIGQVKTTFIFYSCFISKNNIIIPNEILQHVNNYSLLSLKHFS